MPFRRLHDAFAIDAAISLSYAMPADAMPPSFSPLPPFSPLLRRDMPPPFSADGDITMPLMPLYEPRYFCYDCYAICY